MGVSSSPAELARKLGVAAAAMSGLPRVQTKAAALVVKGAIEAIAPARLSGVGQRGADLKVRTVQRAGEGDAQAVVYGTGPWHLIERNTRAHLIPSKPGRGRYAVIPGVGVRAWAHHPGTRGRHPWERGVNASVPAIREGFEASTTTTLRGIF